MKKNSQLELIPWETRNLARPSYQASLSNFDSNLFLDELEEINKNKEGKFFVQVKVPSTSSSEMRALQNIGFRFAEMSFDPWLRIERAQILDEYKKTPERFHPSEFDRNKFTKSCHSVVNLPQVYKTKILEISTAVFKDDRFHMDPLCLSKIADDRIAKWISEDIFPDMTVKCTLISDTNNIVGYILWKDGRFILGGLCSEYIGQGLAKMLYLESMMDVFNAGASELSTTISANNVEVLNLYSRLGFSFRAPTYTLHLWGETL